MNNSIKRRIAISRLLLKIEEHPEYANAHGITDISYYKNQTTDSTKKAS